MGLQTSHQTIFPWLMRKKRKEAFHLHESTPLVGAKTCFVSPFEFPADASISAQRCWTLMRMRIGRVDGGPALGTGSAALSVPSCTLVGHHIANGSGLCTSIISLALLNAFTAKPRTGQSIFFLSTTRYKLIKCGSSAHIIQSRTKLNTYEVLQCQNMQKRLRMDYKRPLTLESFM